MVYQSQTTDFVHNIIKDDHNISVIFGYENQIEEFVKQCNHDQIPAIDLTFKIGNFYVTQIAAKQLIFIEEPLIELPIVCHTYRKALTYNQ